RLVGGVAAAIAGRIGRDVTTVRIVLVVAAVLSGGFAAAAYVVAWMLIPMAIAGAGLILIGRNAPEDEQAMIRRQAQPLQGLATGSRRTGLILRLTVAVILLAGGIAALQSAHENVALLKPLAGVALLISAIVVLLGPWWLRIARDLVVERQ